MQLRSRRIVPLAFATVLGAALALALDRSQASRVTPAGHGVAPA